MFRFLRLAALAGAAFVFAMPAIAHEVRFPKDGAPAFVFEMPKDWTSHVDEDGNLILNSGDHAAGFSLSHAKWTGDLDDFAAEVMQIAKGSLTGDKHPAAISGYSGTEYQATMQNDKGVPLKIRFVVVRIDAKSIASYTELLLGNATHIQEAISDALADSITLTAK